MTIRDYSIERHSITCTGDISDTWRVSWLILKYARHSFHRFPLLNLNTGNGYGASGGSLSGR